MRFECLPAHVHPLANHVNWHILRKVVGDTSSSNRMRTHGFATGPVVLWTTLGTGFLQEARRGHPVNDPTHGRPGYPALARRQERLPAIVVFELDPAQASQAWGPSVDGCPHCNFSGYAGRSGIYELVAIDETLRNLIHEGAGEIELGRHAHRYAPCIRADGLRRIRAGDTSIEEVLRVTPHTERDDTILE
jgi:hypothetical protein